MDIPLVTPNRKRISRKKIWFARPNAATDVSPNWPTINTSLMLSPAVISCWNATGTASASMTRKNSLSRKKERDMRERIKDEIMKKEEKGDDNHITF